MDEAQALADRVAVIADGRIVAEGTPDTLGGRDHAASDVSFTLPPGVRLAAPARRARAPAPSCATNVVHLTTQRARPRRCTSLTGWALGRGLDLHDLTVGRPTLEDVYLRLTEPAGAAAVTGPRLLVLQMRSDLTRFWRNPAVALLHAAAADRVPRDLRGDLQGHDARRRAGPVKLTTFYVPGIMTLGIISATYVNLTVSVVTQRESGELKRVRGTPLPARLRDRQPRRGRHRRRGRDVRRAAARSADSPTACRSPAARCPASCSPS